MSNTNAQKPGYKHTPLGWIPEEWEVRKLNDISYKIGDGLHGTPQYVDKSEYYFINGNNLNNEKIVIDESTKCVSSHEYIKHRKVLMERSILISINGTIGNLALYKGERIVLGKSVAYICCREEYTNYVYHVVKSDIVHSFFKNELTGSTIRNLSLKTLRETPIPLPSIQEQNEISTILNTWDEAIQKTQQLIEQLKQRNRGLSQQLLKPKPTWREYKLSDIFERVTRKNTEANTNVVTISAQRGFVRQDDFFNKQVASEVLDNYFLVEKGEFCYNKSYSKGYDWGATKRLNDFDKAVVTTLYICFRLKDETKHSGRFFEYFFESGLLDVGLSKIAHEGGRAHGLLNVTPHDFFGLKISVPEINEQNRIYNILFTANNELKLYERQLANLQQQKKGLMQKLLSGEVRVKI